MPNVAYDHAWRKFRVTILERDNHQCQIKLSGCEGHATHVDHIVPLSEGGRRLDPTNCRAACKHCNSKRNWRRQHELAKHALGNVTAIETQSSGNW